jgi:hypothetical protein
MKVTGLSHEDLLAAFSATQSDALVHVHYPSNDHSQKLKSACAHALREDGHPAAADALLGDAPFMAIDDIQEAIQVARCVRSRSAALSVNLYWHGLRNEQILDALHEARLEAERIERRHRHQRHEPAFGHARHAASA